MQTDRWMVACIVVLIAVTACAIHYMPEPPLTAYEIRLHQAARDFTNGIGGTDRLGITRGVAQIRVVIPEPIRAQVGGVQVNWSELLAMLGVFSGVVGFIQWIVVRVLIDPMIRNQTEIIKAWAERTFPTTVEFTAHAKSDEDYQDRHDKELDQLWKRINRTE